nr:lytic transglycosylase domain-containing protein [Bradyrhizobium sp. dw_411]
MLATPFRLAVVVTASLAVVIPFTARCETASARVADAVEPWSQFVSEAAERFAIPAAWIRAVMRIESHGNVKAVSAKSAVGLMQIMPATYAELRERYALGVDPYDPHDNIVAGTAYLREMHDRFGASGFLAAYNVGPARYEDHLATGRPLPHETRNYVASLAPLLSDAQTGDSAIATGEPNTWRGASLFVARSQCKSSDTRMSFTPQSSAVGHDRGAVDLSALTPLPGGLFVKQAPAPSKP